ncbi:unnamed protein product, partial [marine sediment metagenome]
CFRTNDLEKVGQTPHHHTLFEMLGNFSLGDYFKEEACEWGWEFVTKELGLRKKNLWITIFREDEETHRIWKKIGIAPSKILKKGEEDNFWSLGEVGSVDRTQRFSLIGAKALAVQDQIVSRGVVAQDGSNSGILFSCSSIETNWGDSLPYLQKTSTLEWVWKGLLQCSRE